MTNLPGRLVEALRSVDVDIAALTARVGDQQLRAGSPAELRRLLSGALYDRLHAGRGDWRPGSAREFTDEDFEDELRAAVPHVHTRVATTVGAVSGDTVVVTLDGVRVRLPVPDADQVTGGQDVLLDIDCVRPRLSPGFLLVNGSAGHGLGDGPVLRVYVAVHTADAAPGVLGAVLAALERLGVPYRAKMTSLRAGFPRRDAAVVYLGRRAWHAAADVADAVRDLAGRGDEVSPYALRLAPGVSVAWDPADTRPGYRGLSFGEHRSLVISTALVEHAKNPASSPESAVEKQFTEAGTDPGAPFRDVTSPDLPDILAVRSTESMRNS